MYRHFLNLISQDFWCPHLFVRADITVPVLYNKDAAVKRSQSHSKVNCKYLHAQNKTRKFHGITEITENGKYAQNTYVFEIY